MKIQALPQKGKIPPHTKETTGLLERSPKWIRNHRLKANLLFKVKWKSHREKQRVRLYAYEATWTPCNKAKDEEPALGFRADRIKAQEEGYVDLSHPVLIVKGIPILYILFLRVPFKSKRQSGFLIWISK